jgi:ribosomal protein L37E
MTALLDNAIAAISMGVEDYWRKEGHRAQSAIRNFYSGVLLLAKEALTRAAPNVAIEDVLAERYRPIPDGMGGIKHVPLGNRTVDFHTLGERFKHFSLPLDTRALDGLSRIRNEIEHKYTTETTDAVREAIARAFTVVADLLGLLKISPAEALGDTWRHMLETRHLYDREVEQCRKSCAAIRWRSKTIQCAELQCPHCSSNFVEQMDPSNSDQECAHLRCRACGKELDTDNVISATLANALAAETLIAYRDSGEAGPISECPDCGNESFLEFENLCAICGYHRNYVQCVSCQETLLLKDGAKGPALCDRCAEDADRAADAGFGLAQESPEKRS